MHYHCQEDAACLVPSLYPVKGPAPCSDTPAGGDLGGNGTDILNDVNGAGGMLLLEKTNSTIFRIFCACDASRNVPWYLKKTDLP